MEKGAMKESLRNLGKIPFTRYDAGWVVLCIGMAIGAGIVFLPVQVGLKGLSVFSVAVVLAYPAIYLLQKFYIITLASADECESYAGIISEYLGKNWGIVLGVAYFLMLANGIMGYSMTITNDSASYLQTYGVTEGLLSDSIWYSLILMIVLVLLSSKGERLLFKITTPMILVILGIIVVLGVVMIPYWNFSNFKAMGGIGEFISDVVLTLPFTLFSILFVQILNPMNIAYRQVEKDPVVATYRAVRVNLIAYVILTITVLFFTFSFAFTLSYDQAVDAYNQNISALAIAAQVIPGTAVKIMATLLSIFAILSSFFGIYLAVKEAVTGLVLNVVTRFIPEERVNKNILSIVITVVIILALWVWISTQFSIIFFMQLGAPLFGLITCFVPCYLILKMPQLKSYRGIAVYYIIFFGIILCLVPLFKYFE